MDDKVGSGGTLAAAMVGLGDGPFHFVSVHANCGADHDARGIAALPDRFHGATSCLGAMTREGKTGGVAVCALSDADGAYDTGL